MIMPVPAIFILYCRVRSNWLIPEKQAFEKGYPDVALVGKSFAKNHYGFAFPEDSPLLEKINLTLLKLKEDGVYSDLYAKWF